jgi:hypothetical protein
MLLIVARDIWKGELIWNFVLSKKWEFLMDISLLLNIQ